MKFFPWLLLPLVVACAKPETNYVLKVKQQNLTPESLYDKDLVYDVIFEAQEGNSDSLKTRSRQLFLKGIDLFKNKKQPARAIDAFISSILTFPEAKTYYELGNALLAKKDAVTALRAYEVAEHLAFQPKANIYYGQAVAHALLKEKDSETDYYTLLSAIESGFSDTVRLYKEPLLKEIVQSVKFKNFMRDRRLHQLASGKPDQLLEIFRNSFTPATQPFEIRKEQTQLEAYSQSISYDFLRFVPEMQNAGFGRDVSHDYFFVAKVAETPQYTALLYKSVGFSGEEMQPVLTKLIILNNQGKVISNLLFSCQCSAEKIKTGKIENNLITLQDYLRYWKQPIDKVDFADNAIEKYEPLATATFRITETGKIVEESVPENYDANQIAIAQQ